MSNVEDFGVVVDEAAEALGIPLDDACRLPIPAIRKPDGDIWYRRRDVERLKRKKWKPKPRTDDHDLVDDEDWDWPSQPGGRHPTPRGWPELPEHRSLEGNRSTAGLEDEA